MSEKSIYEMFATDKNLEKTGVWLAFGPDGKYGRFHIARAGGANTRYAKALEAKTRPIRKSIETGTLDNDEGEAMMLDLYVETVILGWENVRARPTAEQQLNNEPGDLIPYSRAAAKKLMQEVPDLMVEIRGYATNFTNFRGKQIEEDSGN
jgi:hypothetical protein